MQYEIEVKSLLGSQESSDALLHHLSVVDENFKQIDAQSQLNHYFIGGSIDALVKSIKSYFTEEKLNVLDAIAEKSTSFSVRSRQKNGVTFLVVKGSLDATSAVHSHRRIEFEERVNLSIKELDQIIISSGFDYEAKWSAERKMYAFKDFTVDIFFTPGYGYVVEFEKVIHDPNAIEHTRSYILQIMKDIGLEELDAARLERMYAYYNAHWQDYYGTQNVFTIA